MESFLFQQSPLFLLFLLILAAWSLAWKGVALWKAARLGQKPWFVVLLAVNTLGILEIIYIFFVARKMTLAITEPAETEITKT